MSEELARIQKWMHGELIAGGAAAMGQADALLVPNPRLSAADSLAIYQRSYSLRLAACMRDQFPALTHALGEELFNDFVAEYVRQSPPESPTLHDLGRRFTDYLQANRPDRDDDQKEPWIDFIVDLSRFERSLFVAFDGPGAEDLKLADLQTPQSDLLPQPSLFVGEYGFPVGRYYHAVRQELSPDPPEAEPAFYAIVRKDFNTATLALTYPQYLLLRAWTAGYTLDASLDQVAQTTKQDLEFVIQGWNGSPEVLEGWIDAGFFVEENPN